MFAIWGHLPSGKRLYNELENPPMLFMGKSTISTGPCSIANCKRLPEGNPYKCYNYGEIYAPLAGTLFK